MKSPLVTLMTTAAVLMAGASAEAADKLRACWAYNGPVGDFGYTYQHDQGRLAVEKALGDKVQTSYVENVSDGPDADRVFERLAREGCNIIFGTSFGMMDSEVKVAKKFPKVLFEHATGYKTAGNLGIFNARFYEGSYVTGQIAARQSKTGVAGSIVSFPVPEVMLGLNAFMLGAQSVNPNFKTKLVWVNTWFDPGKEADAAKALFDQGADIVVQYTDSSAPLQVAEERKLHGFGASSDMIKFAPNAQYTAVTSNWAPYYVSRVKAALDGTWKSDNVWLGLKDDVVKLSPFTNMPDDVKAMAEATAKKIAGGWSPFTGPVTKQDGTPWLRDGEAADDGTLENMNFFVKGIDDKMPQ